MRIAGVLTAAVITAAATIVRPVSAQKAADHLALGIAAQEAIKPEESLRHFQAALAADSMNYEANWRGAVAAVEVAQLPKSLTDSVMPASADDDSDPDAEAPAKKSMADSLYTLAEAYARRAVESDGAKPQGHFVVAYALAARSMASDPLTRLSLAAEIHREASDALALDPKFDPAHHVVGQWNAEISRLSDFERGFAEGELGDIATNATWDLAIEHLEEAVKLAPNFIYHRLDLGRAYHGAGRESDAKAQWAKIADLPLAGPRDAEYKEQAKALLEAKPDSE